MRKILFVGLADRSYPEASVKVYGMIVDGRGTSVTNIQTDFHKIDCNVFVYKQFY